MVVVLPVPLTPTIRITVGLCETSSSTGPSSMRVACSTMSSRSSLPLVMFLSQGLLLELRDELRRRRHPDVGGDEDLLDPLPELLVLGIPELRHRRVELPDERLPAPATCPAATARTTRRTPAPPRPRARPEPLRSRSARGAPPRPPRASASSTSVDLGRDGLLAGCQHLLGRRYVGFGRPRYPPQLGGASVADRRAVLRVLYLRSL